MVDVSAQARFDITTRHASEPAWSEQLDLIRQAGAQFDSGTRRWFLHVSLDDLPLDRINILFEAASRFGTFVVLQQLT